MTTQSTAKDPVQVDPKHYTVEVENERVRVLRIKYGPFEKSKMHGHPATVAVFLTDARPIYLPRRQNGRDHRKGGPSRLL